jgi:hypothetical protein
VAFLSLSINLFNKVSGPFAVADFGFVESIGLGVI